MSKEAMQLALEALETERNNYQDWDEEDGAPEYIHETITALQEALAEQPAQQESASVTYKEVADAMNALYMGDSKQVQIAKEMENKKLYTSPPPQRKPLTEDEIRDIHWSKPMDEYEFARAIEAAHGIKEQS